MEARAVALAYLKALSDADVATVLSLVADDFHNEHTSELGSSLVGKAGYAERLPGFLSQFVALHYEVVDTLVDDDRVAVRYRMTANAGGSPIDIPGVMWFEIADGLVSRRIDVWDSLTFLRQTGSVDER